MTALTQSGYAVLQAATGIDKAAGIYGVTFPGGILAGDVTTVLLYVAGRWHTEVEPLHPGWCWGWTPKTITGGSGWSNHAGGAAIDINAPAHPQHVRSMNAPTQAKIRRIIADCGGVVRWGGDFGTKDLDQMHTEIAPGKAGAPVAALAARIRAGQAPNVPAPLLTIQEDDDMKPDEPIDLSDAYYPTLDPPRPAARKDVPYKKVVADEFNYVSTAVRDGKLALAQLATISKQLDDLPVRIAAAIKEGK